LALDRLETTPGAESVMRTLRRLMVLMSAVAFGACGAAGQPPGSRPDHLLVMIFDQMRPDYIDRFNLEQFKRLRARSRHYPDAYIGHLAAQTIVSHLVIPTGLPPKDLPWQEDVFLDRDGRLGAPDAAYDTGVLTRQQMWRLLEPLPRQQYLPARLQDAFGAPVFAVGQKDYAATIFGGPYASTIVTMAKANGRCTPAGVNVPDYIAGNPRFSVECAEPYGTGYPTIYALDGSRYVPGNDPSRPGGDIWTADAALEIMQREAWSGLFLTFGGIDKVAHMLGEQDGHGLVSVPSQYRLEDALRIADVQLGRILDALEQRQLAGRTMVVVTADHGGQRHESYLGNGRFQTCCELANVPGPVDPPYWLDHLRRIGTLRTAYADSNISLWLADHSPANERAVVQGLTDVSGMTEIYLKRQTAGQYRYEQIYSNLEAQPPAFQRWAREHSAELVATMASSSSPDVIGLLADGFGFGRIGGHGGTQERVQRIPMIIHVPGEAPSTSSTPFRLIDIAPEAARVLGLPPTAANGASRTIDRAERSSRPPR
jgi:hypothetical protein